MLDDMVDPELCSSAAACAHVLPQLVIAGMTLIVCCSSQGLLDLQLMSVQIFMEEIGSVRGHFGPVNAIAIHPDGRSFATGGEDGYVRINPMQEEKDYLAASTA